MTTLLEADGLAKKFGDLTAVADMSFSIEEGRCAALLGPNGAGKTTTIRMLAGLLAPTSGTMTFQGVPAGGGHRADIGYLPQSPSFYNWMTGIEYVVYAGKLCGLTGSEAKAAANRMLERVGLAAAARKRIGSYSGGMKQRLGLAQALIHRPKLLIMDEPVSALDPVGRREVLVLLRELKQETTVLFSTHVLHDAEELCDDIIIVRDGRIALQGSLTSIQKQYRSSVIELIVDNDEASRNRLELMKGRLASSAAGAALFKHIAVTGSRARMEVAEVHEARRILMEELVRHDIGFVKLEVGHSSLEELFMKVVSQ